MLKPDLHILSLSYGKDSMACIEAVKKLNLPLDEIITVDVMYDDNISANLPAMEEWKAYADNRIHKLFGYKVKHLKAKETFKSMFYRVKARGPKKGTIYGFPMIRGNWCNSILKMKPINDYIKEKSKKYNVVQYVGIASDETNRISRLKDDPNYKLPLVEINWTENYCKEWCKNEGLLSPVYDNAKRDGCWFCHNQRLDQLKLLRKEYKSYWDLMLELDNDSPIKFRRNATIHELDKRFETEDKQTSLNDL